MESRLEKIFSMGINIMSLAVWLGEDRKCSAAAAVVGLDFWAHGLTRIWIWINVHITKTCSSAFYYLYNIRHIRKYLSRSSSETLIHAFITSRLDYCNSLLYGLPKYQLSKLQRVMNASARLV